MRWNSTRSWLAILWFVLSAAAPAAAQNFVMETVGGTFPADGQLLSRVLLDSDVEVNAFDYAVEFDTDVLTLEGVDSSPAIAPYIDFESLDVDPTGGIYRHTVLLDPLLPPGLDRVLSTATYTATGISFGPTSLTFDQPAAGGPPLAAVLDEAGIAYFPDLVEGTVLVTPGAPNPDYAFSFATAPLEPGENNVFDVILDNTGNALEAWSFGVTWDSPELALEIVQLGTAALSVQGGMGPDFVMTSFETQGFTHQVVVDTGGVFTLAPASDLQLVRVTVSASAAAPDGILLSFTDQFGVGVIVDPVLSPPQSGSTIPISLTTALSFDRGDCNTDGSFDVADPTFELTFLFGGGTAPMCEDACDANDDGGMDLADAVSMLGALFSGGPLPPGSGECTPDMQVGSDPLGCDQYLACP